MTSIDTPTVHVSLFTRESDWLSDLIDMMEYAEAMGISVDEDLTSLYF